MSSVPTYEFRCKTCDDVFAVQRPMSQSSDPADCPEGHNTTTKLLSRVMVMGRSGAAAPESSGGSLPMSGCGSGCGCH